MFRWLSPELPQCIPDVFCERHLEPPVLFCEDDQAMLCGQCFLTQDHRAHVVCGVKEAAENYRKLFRELLKTMKEKLEVTKILLSEEQERMIFIQGEEQEFKEVIEAEYKMMFRLVTEENETNLQNPQGCSHSLSLRKASLTEMTTFVAQLEERFQQTIQRLTNLGKENMKKLKESELKLYEQVYRFHQIISELERKCGEGTLRLLKDARYCLDRTSGPLLLPSPEPAQILDPRLCQISGMRPILEALQRPVTLDPTTAHPYLILSEDRKTVRFRNIQHGARNHPGRFDFSASVLGVDCFLSGRHYWEVDVDKATKWQLGVYEDPDYATCGPDVIPVIPKSPGDKFLLTGSKMETMCTFWVFPPLKRVAVGEQIRRVGVFLDYKYGQVAFYNVTKGLLIYNFSRLSFQGALRPILSLCFPVGSTNSDSLTISFPDVYPCDAAGGPQPPLV